MKNKLGISISSTLCVLIVALLTVPSCKQPEGTTEKKSAEQEVKVLSLSEIQRKNAGIEVANMTEMLLGNKISLKGITEVRPDEKVTLTTPSGGYIKELPFMKGMFVDKGTVIATMEDPYFVQLQEDYLKTKLNLDYLEKEWARQKSLFQDRAVSEKNVLATETELMQKRIEKKALEEKLALLQLKPGSISVENIHSTIQLRAPISGYISKISANVGMRVSQTEPILEIIDVSKPYLTLSAFEKDIPHLKPGQKILAYTNQNSNQKIPGLIKYVGQEISHEGYADIICEFTQRVNFPTGMFMNAEIETENITCMALPDEALVPFEGKTYVFSEPKPGSYEMMEVMPGRSENGFTEILSGADKSQKFVIKGAYVLLMELKNTAE